MSQTLLPPQWLKLLTDDPYAVLGISVMADENRIIKRYRTVAKQLHPDRYASSNNSDRELATALFTRVLNPAYEKLKQQNNRAEIMAMLRFQARRIPMEKFQTSQNQSVQQLLQTPPEAVDVVYEGAIAQAAETLYKSLPEFHQVAQQLRELNLVYLRLKTHELFIREKSTGIVPRQEYKPLTVVVEPQTATKIPEKNYAQSHYDRALVYAKNQKWSPAVQELRDALKLQPNNSDYHALIGYVYLKQNLTGMAKAHIRQALKLHSQHPLASKCAALLKINLEIPNPPPPKSKAAEHSRLGALLNWFSTKGRSVSKASTR
ncbi:MAG: DnaJ domain-containing protein [Nostocaceae cyanobacterium]|nr:DnaJ domain-containing protein [Nostocaceae cyanobacterium]